MEAESSKEHETESSLQSLPTEKLILIKPLYSVPLDDWLTPLLFTKNLPLSFNKSFYGYVLVFEQFGFFGL